MEFYSSPTILPNMNTAVGTNKGVMFGGPSASPAAPITNLGSVLAQPTLAAGNRVMVVEYNSLAVLQNNAVVAHTAFPGVSIARAGASGTHVFVSTTNGLHTFDQNAHRLFTLPWHGGISSPAIGPQGHVYVTDDSNGLYVFPPPTERERQDIGRGLQI
jgi:outer membrane protein assembly factor BamB